MFKKLKEIWYGRPETEEEREFRIKAHRGILASGAGLHGVGEIEEDNGNDKVCNDSNPNRGDS
jgi:hypothetical protein